MAIEWGPIIASGISAAAGLGSTVVQSNLNKKNREWQEQQAAIQREYSTEMMNRQNAWNMEMWQKENEYNSPEAQVQRLRDAGLNPLYYGLDGTSANALESAQPLGYERAESNFQTNPLAAGIDAFVQAKGIENSTKLANAQIDKLKEETRGNKISNDFQDATAAARAESINLANNLSKKQVEEINQSIKESGQRIKESIQRTDNLVEEKALMESQKMLNRALEHEADERAREIATLLPYKQLLIEAQTEAEKAHATYLWTQQAKEQKLIDEGFYDTMVKTAEEELKRAKIDVNDAKVQQAIHQWQLAIKTGTAFDIEGQKGLGRVLSILGNVGTSFVSTCAEAMGGSIVPLFGAGIVGKGVSKAGSMMSKGATLDVVSKQTAALQ